jgi:hypothetical protein
MIESMMTFPVTVDVFAICITSLATRKEKNKIWVILVMIDNNLSSAKMEIHKMVIIAKVTTVTCFLCFCKARAAIRKIPVKQSGYIIWNEAGGNMGITKTVKTTSKSKMLLIYGIEILPL